MGLVLAFQSAPRQTPRPAMRRSSSETRQNAEILFFTGVRYERQGEARASEPTRSTQPCELPSSHS